MALTLTPLRVGLAVLGVGALTALAVGGPDPYHTLRRHAPAVDRAYHRLNALAQTELARYLAAARIDSVARAYAAGMPAGLTVATAGNVPVGTARTIEAAARLGWQRAGAPSAVPVLVVAVVDTASAALGIPRPQHRARYYFEHHLPTIARPWCTIIVRLPLGALDASATSTDPRRVRGLAEAFPGVCGFVARHGPPGAGARAWLAETDGVPAFSSHQPEATSGRDQATRATIWNDSDPFAYLWTRGRRLLAGCLLGDTGACADITGMSADPLPDAGGPIRVAYWSSLQEITPWQRYLADLADGHDRERFLAFWRNDAPAREAFAEAFGAPVGAWTLAWARARYGRGPPGLRRTAASYLVCVLFGLAFATGGLVYATRRTVA